MSNTLPIKIISTYKFINLTEDQLEPLKSTLQTKVAELELKGTILLGREGINMSVAGAHEKINTFKDYLALFPAFDSLPYKENYHDVMPFAKMKVRIRKEIVSMGGHDVDAVNNTAQFLSPEELHEWYRTNKEMIVLDTRNNYEFRLGAFKDAIDLQIENFRDFPAALSQLPPEMKSKPIVTYCTGGIRCEKATALMLEQGFTNVYQLEGGILNYFAQFNNDFYHGECFVFDDRISVDANMDATGTQLCKECQERLESTTAAHACA